MKTPEERIERIRRLCRVRFECLLATRPGSPAAGRLQQKYIRVTRLLGRAQLRASGEA